MVRRATQICVQQLTSSWRRTASRWFQSYEYGVDPLQHDRVVHLQHPTAPGGIGQQKQAEILWLALIPLPVSPGLEAGSRALMLLILQIEGIEKQKFFLHK